MKLSHKQAYDEVRRTKVLSRISEVNEIVFLYASHRTASDHYGATSYTMYLCIAYTSDFI